LMDMLLWKFGKAKWWNVHIRTKTQIVCEMSLEKATVLFKLSIEEGPIRSMSIDGENVDFNDGFADLHTVCYRDILNGGGYGVDDVYETIHLINQINEYSSSDSRPR
jgi:UDP-N-acetyl-2-amino-2-deoxyglucuronate dehydrogenase